MSGPAGQSPKNIILLSDGTGNSALSFNKSNVWRLFTTLDLGPGSNQIAYYDDGVGTSGIKFLRALGGGFGWGLSRNVRQMYAFLCRHYRPGDRIYIFGFSRGAFTARVLAHFIGVCGILDRSKSAPGEPGLRMETERGFRRGVKQAYKSYRRRYWDDAWLLQRLLGKAFRSVRNLLPGWRVLPADDFKRRYSLPAPPKGQYLIDFLGVWDTVDAVGLPVDELSDLLDKFIYPYKFPNQSFSEHVARASHALAIDDERQSFHPVLWDESKRQDAARIKQVWFAGMHSNVGGGYPEDNLGYISLDWMVEEVCAKQAGAPGLVFNPQKCTVFKHRAEPTGKLYDSRRGAAVYYRYKPRYIADLSNQHVKARRGAVIRRDRIHIPDPKIHHSVLDRIADTKAGYAPVGLPPDFSVVDANGSVTRFSDPAFHDEGAPGGPPAPADRRAALLERTRNHVFWRRFAYFALLLLTFAILAMPVYEPPIPGWEPPADGWERWASKGLEASFEQLDAVIPDFANYWTDAWTQSAGLFLFFAACFLVVFVWSYWIEGNLRELSEGAYWHVKGSSPPRSIRETGVFERFAGWLRPSFFWRHGSAFFSRFLVPLVFAILSLYVIVGGGYRLLVHYPFVKDGVCRLVEADAAQGAITARTDGDFWTDDPCFRTNVVLQEGKRYRVSLTGNAVWSQAMDRSRLRGDPLCLRDYEGSSWMEDTYPATAKGLNCVLSRFNPPYLVGLPARRHLAYPWFTLVGEIRKDSGTTFPLNQPEFVFRPKLGGPLYLYVNDAIGSWPFFSDWKRFYENNEGRARVVFEREGAGSTAADSSATDVPTIRIVELAEDH